MPSPQIAVTWLAALVDALDGCRTGSYRKRARSVPGGCPTRSAVQTHSFISNNLDETAAVEGFRVGLPLDL